MVYRAALVVGDGLLEWSVEPRSGDGRLSNGADGYHATDGDKGTPVLGVDDTGWRNEVVQH